MTSLRAFGSRLVDLLVHGRRERQLRDEIQAHLDTLADDYEAQGLSRRDAEAAARRAFGGVDQIKEAYRDQRGVRVIESLLTDVRQACRLLWRERRFTALAVLTLATGIAVSNAAFTIVNAICLRGLPIDRPERVLMLTTLDAESRPAGLSYGDFDELRRANPSFSGMAAYAGAVMTVSDEGRPADRVTGAYISAGAFDLLGESPRIGREIATDEDRDGAQAVVVIGGQLWRSRYDADPAIVGRTIVVNGSPATVVGVMPEGFRFPGTAEIWQPLTRMPGITALPRDARVLSTYGRMADEVAIAGVQAEMDAIAADLARQHTENRDVRLRGVPINEHFNGRITDTVWLAFSTVSILLLLVATANVANLLLMRAAHRAREIAIRSSVGATRLRIVRQLLVESGLLAVLAGAAGLALSVVAVRLLAASVPQSLPLPYWIQFTVDLRVLAFLIVVCVSSVLLCGLAPALHLSSVGAGDALKESGRSATRGTRARRWTSGLLALEFALSLPLLAAVGLSVRQFRDAQRAETPVDASRLLVASLTLPEQPYDSSERRRALYDELLERLTVVGGVSGAAIASHAPQGGARPQHLAIAGRAPAPQEPAPLVQTVTVTLRYFDVLGVPIVRGRAFADADGSPGQEVAIVNQRFADLYVPGGDPIGQRIKVAPVSSAASESTWLTIVGVSPNIRQRPVNLADAIVYLPAMAAPLASGVLIVKATSGEPGTLGPAVREEVRRLDANLPLYRLMSMEQSIRESGWNGRVSAVMLRTMAVVTLVLSLIGLYAVTSHGVVQRTRELGVRIAVGAGPGAVTWLVVRRVLAQLLLGLTLGIGCVFAFQRFLGDPTNPITAPVTLVPLLATLVLVSLLACLAPILRAVRLDPVKALRHE